MNARKPRWRRAAALAMLLPMALLQGCWDIRDIDNRMLVAVMGFAGDDESGVTVFLRFPVPHSEQEGGGAKDFLSASQHGATAVDALDQLRARMPKFLDMSQTRAILVDRKLAEKRGIYDCLDFIVRDRVMPINAIFTLYDGDMGALFERPNPSGELSGVYTRLYFEKYAGGTPQKNKVTLWEVFSRHYNPLQQSLVPLLVKDTSFRFALQGNAYFAGDKMAGVLLPSETLIYDLVTGRMSPFEIETAGGANVKIQSSRARIHTEWSAGKPVIRINVNVSMKLMDAPHKAVMNTSRMQEAVDKLLEERAARVFAKTQAAGSDIFGFGNRFRSSMPVRAYDKWPSIYKRASISLKVKSHMRNEGLKLLQD
ncbi:Ger(x)C family spore germination protein [Cohnella sp. JJ-181]|uniref:Ger(x)C family spore germination protein n=1 Tax=Cohnella rhizoplanae TaxID=2974897 RepID=UPI0022FF52ED|nr:Ger(x)C family spore germination protein [Cohnella sp. JJ-181]CAI6076438.1 hypothetical protein COHCIP112018_02523 [Cohnella sp. JJ-181]